MTRSHLSVTSSLALGVLAVASVASAEPHETYRHAARAQQVLGSRSITHGEQRVIAKNRRQVIHLREHAFRDGYVTRREAKKIRQAKRGFQNSIYWAKHNDKVRKRPRNGRTDHERFHPDWYRRW